MQFQTVISATQLSLIAGRQDLVIIDCRFSLMEPELGYQQYQQAHIEGALYADLDKDLSSPVTDTSGRHPLPDSQHFSEVISRWGLTPDTQVVVYDDNSGFFAARLWWLLKASGHTRVALLDGNLQAWIAAGNLLDTGIPEVTGSNYRLTIDPESYCEAEALQAGLDADQLVLIDARAAERYNGDVEPIDPVAGHIPGAINLPITSNLDGNGLFLSAAELNQRYSAAAGSVPAHRVIHMCGSGVFACHAILAMEIAGLYQSKLYPGSWSEWIQDESRSIVRGGVTDDT